MDNEETKKRRDKLKQMRDELPETSSTNEDNQGAEMITFAKTLKEQKERRTKQFAIIKELFEDPLTFDLDKQVIPTSSNREEIVARQSELQYRIDILKSILEVADAEMQILMQALQTRPEDKPENSTE